MVYKQVAYYYFIIWLWDHGIILEVAKYPSSDNMIMYLINCYSLIPVLAAITLLTGIYADKLSFLFMIRVTSIITVLLCFVPDILIVLNLKSSDIVQIISMFADSGRSFGFYLTISSAAIALGVTLLRNSLEVSPKKGNTQSQ